MNKTTFFAHVRVSAIFISAGACGSSAAAAERQAIVKVSDQQMQVMGIQLLPLQRQGEQAVVSLPAQVVLPPGREQVISAPVTGLATQLFVQPNQSVKQGAPLVRIASAEWGQLQLQLVQASSRASLARQTAQRERALLAEGIIPQRRVQEADATLHESEAALHQARLSLRMAGAPPATIDRIAAGGKPEDSLILRAQQGGIVTEISVQLGQRVDATSPLLHIAQTDQLWLDIQVPSADSANWKSGSKFKLQGSGSTARIVSISPTVAPGSQTVVLRAVVESGADMLRPGEFVKAELAAGGGAGGWAVPLGALAHEGKQAYVFVRQKEGFEARPVKVAASGGQRVRIEGVLAAGEQLAVSGVVALKGAWLDGQEGK